jgi:tryptophan synthase alpha chain
MSAAHRERTRRFDELFARLDTEGRAALIAYFPYGFPQVDTGERLIEAIATVADALEIGIPFSDPTADGPTIQRAIATALANGVTPRQVIDFLPRLRTRFDGPLALMTYANIVYRYGVRRFFEDAAAAGADGLIVPDVPFEERHMLSEGGDALDVILMAAPTTDATRLASIAKASRGFLYLVSSLGTTGARDAIDERGVELARRAREAGAARPCLGFGISTAAQAARYAQVADGVIIGSAIIDRVTSSRTIEDAIERVTTFLTEIKDSLYRKKPPCF